MNRRTTSVLDRSLAFDYENVFLREPGGRFRDDFCRISIVTQAQDLFVRQYVGDLNVLLFVKFPSRAIVSCNRSPDAKQ